MTDLAVLVPTRGRPANIGRLIKACAETCRANTVLHFGLDEDDPRLAETLGEVSGQVTIKPRMGLVAWTNELAREHLQSLPEFVPPYLASIGDDMVPRTDGWDEQLITELEHIGGGFAYPDDRRRSDIPEAVIVSAPIVRALGWMALPALEHWYPDNVWADLGRGAGCLVYCPGVLVEHLHPNVTGEPGDATYHDAARKFNQDAAAYRKWRLYDMPKDIAKVRQARADA